MNPKVGTLMGKLSLVGGIRQEQVTNVAAVKPAHAIFSRHKKERLYIVVEVTGDLLGRDEIYRELTRIIGKEYFQTRGSITARLRQAISAANSYLLQENLRSLPHKQRAGGVTCAVLKEGNVYIAHAGPTAAYVSYQGKLSRFPETAVDELIPEDAAPLGFKRGVPVRFYRSKVGLGDVILLASGFLAREASTEQIAQAIVGQDIDPALAHLEGLAGEGETSALLIRVAPVEERARVQRQAVARQPARPRETPPPRVKKAPAQVRATPPKVSEVPRGIREAPPKVSEAPPKVGEVPRGIREAPSKASKTPSSPMETLEERLPRTDWDSLKRRVSSALVSFLKATGNFLKRLLPEAEGPAARERAPSPKRPSRLSERIGNFWMGLAIALPVIVVILVAVVSWQEGVARRTRFTELMTQAQQHMEMASRVDEPTARDYLLKALASLTEAETVSPGNSQVSELREQVNYILKKIDRVAELEWINPLWKYDEPGSDPSRVIIAKDIDVYVLDRNLDWVYKHLLDNTMHNLQELEVDPVLLRKGDQRDPIVVGELVDMTWARAEGSRPTNSLLVLESGGSLLEYEPLRGIQVLPIGGSDQWIQPQVLRSYGGNLYLLDSGLNQILRYEPNYGGAPEGYFTAPGAVDLAGAVDMAIDGQIYILYADGRILKLVGGEPVPFEITGLYEPLQNPTAIFTNEETEFLYIADRGNKRILQLTKAGHVQRQLRAVEGSNAFDELKSLYAIERFHLLYFLSGDTLYVTNIPAE